MLHLLSRSSMAGREKECEKKTQSFLLQSLIFEQLRQHHCMTYIKKLQAQRGNDHQDPN